MHLNDALQANQGDNLSCFQVSHFGFSWWPVFWRKLPCVFCRDCCREFGNSSLCSCSDKLHQEGTLSLVQCQSVISCNPKKGYSETPNVTNISRCCYMQHSTLSQPSYCKWKSGKTCICQEIVHFHYTYGTLLEKRGKCLQFTLPHWMFYNVHKISCIQQWG